MNCDLVLGTSPIDPYLDDCEVKVVNPIMQM